ncbi:hypothetical protein ADINL_0849 [Nitrincola lacisaponensis]|uniref:Uncharacterized protein n=2 Tax=Nitrincola lacisaponensis TaxID=267850 RepID=A0A063Y742_9GAMM|nr:hypothetical protein ADINL_0849 [Nitrincola lacisaponensis]
MSNQLQVFAMISTVEMNILLALKRLGKRNGIFPPVMMTLKDQFAELDYNTFFKHLMVLQEQGYLKIAAGKSRGIFISPAGVALAEQLENDRPEFIPSFCATS